MKQMGSKYVHFDFHIHTPGVNHDQSEDCWCEPTKTYWVPTASGRLLHVLEHNDAISNEANSAWVKETLDEIGR